jgi:RNA polymerase sigma factor (sigma-70 family)
VYSGDVALGRGRTSPAAQLRDVYRDNVSAVYAYFGYVVPPDIAEDLTAATFERVVRFWGTFDSGRGRPRTWILAIARNVLADHFRRSRSERAVSLDEHPELVDRAGAAEDPFAHREDVESLLSLLSGLNALQREVLALRFGADLRPAQIAEHLELSEANVYQILSRALRRLREQLASGDDRRSAPQLVGRVSSSSGASAPRTAQPRGADCG